MRRLTAPGGAPARAGPIARPRLAFAGLGWIGLHRMRALARSGRCEIVALADPDPQARAIAAAEAPGAAQMARFGQLLATRPDGVVIATPNALHAAQAIAALDAGAAVFCQKPLARDGAEAAAVVAAARRADRLLGVDLSYRHAAALSALRAAIHAGQLGRVYALDLVFHNAYGPDKPWYRDPAQAGGGCLADLGVHLADLALWLLGWPELRDIRAALHAGGMPVTPGAAEDHAAATLTTAAGTRIGLACSWWAHAGAEAVIGVEARGTEGGARMANLDGSFYDFALHLHRGTTREEVVAPPDDWGGRAALAWLEALAAGGGHDPAAEEFVTVARVLDRIAAAGRGGGVG